jgi:hypothetical protein
MLRETLNLPLRPLNPHQPPARIDFPDESGCDDGVPHTQSPADAEDEEVGVRPIRWEERRLDLSDRTIAALDEVAVARGQRLPLAGDKHAVHARHRRRRE